jgi:hypothetical protein
MRLPHRRDRRDALPARERDRIVGISGYVVRPLQARREKPRVSAFTSANMDKVLTLEPNLVLTFSDLQADIVADHIRRGLDRRCLQSARPARWSMLANRLDS